MIKYRQSQGFTAVTLCGQTPIDGWRYEAYGFEGAGQQTYEMKKMTVNIN